MERPDRQGSGSAGDGAKTAGGKFVAEGVVRRDPTPEELDSPRHVNRQLGFFLEKTRDSLPRLERMWPDLAEETHERWRRSWRRDMQVLERIGALHEAGKVDEEGEKIYADLLVALRRAVPTLRRLGLAQPSVPLEAHPLGRR